MQRPAWPQGSNYVRSMPSLIEIQQRILSLRKTAEELKQSTGDFPALARNTARILASIKMLELNLSDVVEAGLSD